MQAFVSNLTGVGSSDPIVARVAKALQADAALDPATSNALEPRTPVALRDAVSMALPMATAPEAPALHVAVFLVLLGEAARISNAKESALDGPLMAAVEAFITSVLDVPGRAAAMLDAPQPAGGAASGGSPVHAPYAATALVHFGHALHAYGAAALAANQPRRGLFHLLAAAEALATRDRADPSNRSVTAAHAAAAELALKSHYASAVQPLLDVPLFDATTALGGASAYDVLDYYYYGGLCLFALQRTRDAVHFLQQCFTVPARGLSVRVVQAGKAYVLARFVVTGAESGTPALSNGYNAIAAATFAKCVQPYVQLVNAFIANERGAAGATAPGAVFQAHQRTFQNDGLLGMVHAAEDAARVHRVCGLSRSYVSLTTDAFGAFAKAPSRDGLLQTLRRICASNGALVVLSADDQVVSFDPSMTAGATSTASPATTADAAAAPSNAADAAADHHQVRQQEQQELIEALIQGWGGEETGGYFSFFAPASTVATSSTASAPADAAEKGTAATTNESSKNNLAPSEAALAAFAARPSPAGANPLEALQQTLEANTRVARYTEKLATSHGYLLSHTQGFRAEILPDPKELRRQRRDLMGDEGHFAMMGGGGGGFGRRM